MVKKILIIKHGSFGDIIQINGCLRDIRENYLGYKLYVLTSPSFKNYFVECPFIDQVIIDKRKSRWNLLYLFQLKKLIEEYSFTTVFDLQNSNRTDFYRKYLFPKLRWFSSRTILKINETKKKFDENNILEKYKIQLSRAKIKTKYTLQPQVSWMIDQGYEISTSIKKNYIVIFPFSSSSNIKTRAWPYFDKLIELLNKKYSNFDIIAAPGPSEILTAKKYKVKLCLHKGKATNFFQLAKILVGAKYVISNNTGPAHLAAHLGCKGLALIGKPFKSENLGIETDNFSAIFSENLGDIQVNDVIEKIDTHL